MHKKEGKPITKAKKLTLAKKKKKARVLPNKKEEKTTKVSKKVSNKKSSKLALFDKELDKIVIEAKTANIKDNEVLVKNEVEQIDKHYMFIRYYCADMNGTRAAIKAGYSPNIARQIAARLLSKDYIKEAIAEYMKPRIEELDLEVDDLLKWLKDVFDKCMQRKKILKRVTRYHNEDVLQPDWTIRNESIPEDVYEEVIGEFNPAWAIAAYERIANIKGIYKNPWQDPKQQPKEISEKQKVAILALGNAFKTPEAE